MRLTDACCGGAARGTRVMGRESGGSGVDVISLFWAAVFAERRGGKLLPT